LDTLSSEAKNIVPVSKIYDLFSTSLIGNEALIRSAAIYGLALLVGSGLAPADSAKPVIQRTTQLLFDDPETSVKSQCLTSLARLSTGQSSAVLEESIPKIMSALQTARSSITEKDDIAALLDVKQPTLLGVALNAISSLSGNFAIFQHVVPKVVEMLRTSIFEGNQVFATCLVSTLSTVVSTASPDSLKFTLEHIAPTIVASFILKLQKIQINSLLNTWLSLLLDSFKLLLKSWTLRFNQPLLIFLWRFF